MKKLPCAKCGKATPINKLRVSSTQILVKDKTRIRRICQPCERVREAFGSAGYVDTNVPPPTPVIGEYLDETTGFKVLVLQPAGRG